MLEDALSVALGVYVGGLALVATLGVLVLLLGWLSQAQAFRGASRRWDKEKNSQWNLVQKAGHHEVGGTQNREHQQ